MNPQRLRAPTADELHEARIMECYGRWLNREAKWSELQALIAQRSPEQVRRMEERLGLR